jgi:peptidoglycan/LPS O-acetylase OafA/YrhL
MLGQAPLTQHSAAMPRISSSVTSKEFYIPALDGIRAVAFLLVFVAHLGLNRVVPGGFGVTVFFFLSGYLITTLLRIELTKTGKISLKTFYLRRCRRILPPMCITLAIGALLGFLGVLESSGSMKGFLGVILYYFNYARFFQHGSALPTGMGVTWSLMIEEHFYFFFPLLYVWFQRKSFSRNFQTSILLSLCVAGLAWRLILVYLLHVEIAGPGDDAHLWTYIATDARFDAILWGCILAISDNPWYRDDAGLSWIEHYKGYLALLGAGFIGFTFLYRDAAFRQTARYSIQSACLYFVFYYCIATRKSWVSRLLDVRPLRKIGQHSYAMYLIHYSVIEALIWHLHLSLVPLALLSFAITFLYALLMRRFVEDPLRRLAATKRRGDGWSARRFLCQLR